MDLCRLSLLIASKIIHSSELDALLDPDWCCENFLCKDPTVLSGMRNLRNVHRSVIRNDAKQPVTACHWDVNGTSSVVCAFGPTERDPLLELKRWGNFAEDFVHIASWDAACPNPDVKQDEIVNLHFFSDTSTAVVVLAGGDLVIVRETPSPLEAKIEIVGSVDAGISAAAWSPDEEILAIVTKASTILYMTRDIDNIVDLSLSSDDFKVSSHVSVGWGKAETQFKGKKARALRDPTVPENVDEGVLHPSDTLRTSISWRGDGSYVAVNSIEGSRRVIRVFSRDGILESVSEPVDNLTDALSWRPAGNLISGIQRSGDEVGVVFFEKNGLRHGQFDLRLSTEDAEVWADQISLDWNSDSTVLCVRYKDRIQLWQMGNYHYYLKQEIRGSNDAETLTHFSWHPEKPLSFSFGTRSVIQRLVYSSKVAGGPPVPPVDYGLVAVIGGKRLKLTPLRNANVPPPYALHELNLDDNILDVAIIDLRANHLLRLAVLQHERILMFDYDIKNEPVAILSTTTSTYNTQDHSMALQIELLSSDTLAVLYSAVDGAQLYTLSIPQASEAKGLLGSELTTKYTIGRRAEMLIPQRIEGNAFAHVTVDAADRPKRQVNGDHQRSGYKVIPTSTQTSDAIVLDVNQQQNRRLCEHEALKMSCQTSQPSILFRLDAQNVLYADDRRLVTGCTSFLVTQSHLLFTSNNLLKFVHLSGKVGDLVVPPNTPETDERCRNIERGAKLVTVMPSAFAVVLQMPRGNLETIYPRALVLAGIRDKINERKYKGAFLACRDHRVDMNILHDHDSQQFLESVGPFVDKVKKPEHIDLFLSQLREENVAKTMYRDTVRPVDEESQGTDAIKQIHLNHGSKVNRICEEFLKVLVDRPPEYLQNVLSAHVCKVPPDMNAALQEIAELRASKSDHVDSMIEHICFLADANKLYDNALGLYDLELTLLIAQQSQKDPKEYLPILRNLQKMPNLRRQYSIDDMLGRNERALQYLCKLDAFEEVKTYVVKHDLYNEALIHYRYEEPKHQELLRLYAEHLQQTRMFKEAGIAFESLDDHVAASEAFRQAQMWQECLSNATQAHMETHQFFSLATNLCEILTESKDYAAAGTVSVEYLSDTPAAVKLFCKGYHFAHAIRLAGLYQRLDLLESVIDPGLQEGMAHMVELLADCKSQLNAQIPRIRELRTKKVEDPLAFWEGEVPGGGAIPDDVSIAATDASTTGGSLFTRYTNRTGTVGTNATRRTSKNRRREERKRARGKKGSVYEEEYLVNSVGRLIDRVNMISDEVSRLVVGLMRRRMREQARSVEAAMAEVVALCQGCVGEVFETAAEPPKEPPEDPDSAGYRPQGGEAVLMDSLEESGKPREVPLVRDFERLSLLRE